MSDLKQQYKTILDNLIDVQTNDSSIFTRVDNNLFYDLLPILATEDYFKIINNENFQTSLLNKNILKLFEKVKHFTDINSLKEFIHNTEIKRPNFKTLLESKKDIKEITNRIQSRVEFEIQNSLKNWKILSDKANSILEQTNIWPLHIGFLFISIKHEEKFIYAPLFFKQVRIDFKNGTKPILVGEGEIKINEKVLFFLNSIGKNIQIDSDLSFNSMQEIINKVRQDWNGIYSLPEVVFSEYEFINKDDVEFDTIKFYPGAVLGLFQPSGGYSRNIMKKIIDNNELQKIITVEINKNNYKKAIRNSIFNPNINIFKITKTNYSQDQAIISSFIQHTIIWGPPGTGKSQTIVNLLANILAYGKTAIVASQKKAALDVLKQRLNGLEQFCLFMLKTKESSKRQFYKPIKEYLLQFENFISASELKPTPIVNSEEIEYIKLVNNYLNDEQAQSILQAYYYLSKKYNVKDYQNEIEFILGLPSELKYPNEPINPQDLKKILLKLNNAFWIFYKKYQKISQLADSINLVLPEFNGSLQDLVTFFKIIKHDYNFNNKENPFTKLNKIIEFSKKIDYNQIISDVEILKSIIIEHNYNQLMQSEELKEQYIEFAQSVRVENYEPYKFIKKYAKIIKILFRVIVTTPDIDLSIWDKEEFDFAILDESSQIFVERGLPILYLAKIKILAGDPEQMRPSNWFETRSVDDSIFGATESMLDYAYSLNVFKILLDKNYRSNYASLMSFSSKNFYNSQLDVIDVNSDEKHEALEVYNVDGEWIDNKNIVEAEKVLELLENNIPKYKKIILLSFNIKQSEFIKNLIFDKYPKIEEFLRNGSVLVRNIENIQGDEADLVIATVAYDKNTKLHSTYICKKGGKNALNVAISRAKDKMIIVKTIQSNQVSISENSSEDMILFKEWLYFLEKDSNSRQKEIIESFNKKISSNKIYDLTQDLYDDVKVNHLPNNSKWFVSKVLQEVVDECNNKPEYEVFQNYNVGSINIDLVVTKNQKPYKCFIFDVFDYGINSNNFNLIDNQQNNIEKYVLIRDKYWFLRSKKYQTYIVSPISWIEIQKELSKWFATETKENYRNEEKINDNNEQNQKYQSLIKTNEIQLSEKDINKELFVLDQNTNISTIDSQVESKILNSELNIFNSNIKQEFEKSFTNHNNDQNNFEVKKYEKENNAFFNLNNTLELELKNVINKPDEAVFVDKNETVINDEKITQEINTEIQDILSKPEVIIVYDETNNIEVQQNLSDNVLDNNETNNIDFMSDFDKQLEEFKQKIQKNSINSLVFDENNSSVDEFSEMSSFIVSEDENISNQELDNYHNKSELSSRKDITQENNDKTRSTKERNNEH
ncbi:DEAD/DEAH box helicase [Mycoplasma leonicaptivi]|uniref:DEAD/DEAH box helicase n=1 Tax=Mycoplasma leonicaptivi TaxID=36742 RepID=UPI000683D6AF|nr:AAA domain-containing protein [Mycoplasma leonicaptivi]